jgi:hypothetical protein
MNGYEKMNELTGQTRETVSSSCSSPVNVGCSGTSPRMVGLMEIAMDTKETLEAANKIMVEIRGLLGTDSDTGPNGVFGTDERTLRTEMLENKYLSRTLAEEAQRILRDLRGD